MTAEPRRRYLPLVVLGPAGVILYLAVPGDCRHTPVPAALKPAGWKKLFIVEQVCCSTVLGESLA